MDDQIEDIKVDLDNNQNNISNKQVVDDSFDNDVELLDESYLSYDRKKPSYFIIIIFILLVAFVFSKKFMASKIDNKPFQVVEDIMKENAKGNK